MTPAYACSEASEKPCNWMEATSTDWEIVTGNEFAWKEVKLSSPLQPIVVDLQWDRIIPTDLKLPKLLEKYLGLDHCGRKPPKDIKRLRNVQNEELLADMFNRGEFSKCQMEVILTRIPLNSHSFCILTRVGNLWGSLRSGGIRSRTVSSLEHHLRSRRPALENVTVIAV